MQMVSNSNRSVVERDSVEVQKIDFQTFRNPARKTIYCDVKHGTTNICGSDLHAVRGRTMAPAGIAGAAACFLGLMTAPVAIVIGLGVIYDQYAAYPPVRRAFVALAAAAAANLLAAAWKIASPLRGRTLAIGVATCTFVAIAVLRLPLMAALPVLTIGSALLLRRFGK